MTKRLLALALAALLALAAPGLTPTASAAPGDGTLTARVYASYDGNTLANVDVDVWPLATYPAGTPIASGETNEAGELSLALPPGQYGAQYSKSGFTVGEQTFAIAAEETYWSEIYLRDDEANHGTLTGTITRGGAPIPLGCGHVEIYDAGAERYLFTVHTGRRGVWQQRLRPGSYKVEVDDDCRNSDSVWLPEATNWADAATYTVTSKTTTPTATVDLKELGSISGLVTDANGKPVPGVVVTSYRDFWSYTSATTDLAGRYSMSGLESGDYVLRFQDSAGEYVEEWNGDQPSRDTAPLIPVTAGQAKTVNASLQLATDEPEPTLDAVTGTILDAKGAPLRGMSVTLYRSNGESISTIRTGNGGRFTFPRYQAPTGTYKLHVDGWHSGDNDLDSFEDQWYTGAYTPSRATPVVVKPGVVTTLAPVKLNRLGSITGAVTMPEVPGSTDEYSWVDLYDMDGNEVEDAEVNDGTFRFQVRAGKYLLRAGGVQYTSGSNNEASAEYPFISSWWRNGNTFANATPITVSAGGKVSGVNLRLTRNLKAIVAPKITGTAKAGKTLAAANGTWNQSVDVRFSYTWKRGSSVVGRAATYKVTKADQGKTITLSVTAAHRDGALIAGTATAKPVKVAKPAKAKKSKKSKKGKKKSKK